VWYMPGSLSERDAVLSGMLFVVMVRVGLLPAGDMGVLDQPPACFN
jgi:hypothetical protein